MQNRISTKITHTVTLGQAGYGSTLTITQSGAVAPAYSMLPQVGADGIDIAAGVASARIFNQGSVVGAAGSVSGNFYYGYAGGVGINFSASGTLSNQGTVAGGAGGYADYTGGNGGTGIHLGSGVMLANTGVVLGGEAGAAYSGGNGNGGAGVLGDGTDRISNGGTIQGGGGGQFGGGVSPSSSASPVGVGGTGVILGDASRLNVRYLEPSRLPLLAHPGQARSAVSGSDRGRAKRHQSKFSAQHLTRHDRHWGRAFHKQSAKRASRANSF